MNARIAPGGELIVLQSDVKEKHTIAGEGNGAVFCVTISGNLKAEVKWNKGMVLRAELWTQGGLVTYYVLFFIHLATRRVHIAGITPHPNEPWMIQVARNVTMADVGFLSSSRYLIHDRDSKFCESFRDTIEGVSVTPVRLPARSPDLNAFAAALGEIGQRGMSLEAHLVRENSLRHALKEYVAHHHHERNHQGKDNLLLFPEPAIALTRSRLKSVSMMSAGYLSSGGLS